MTSVIFPLEVKRKSWKIKIGGAVHIFVVFFDLDFVPQLGGQHGLLSQ